MEYVYDDGGRNIAGYKGSTGDCATRAIAIATNTDYKTVYDLVNSFCAKEKPSKRRHGNSSARTGVHTVTMQAIMKHLEWKWIPTMTIGSGCRVHLKTEELPLGRIITRLSRHYTAVIDGVLHDTYDCSTPSIWDDIETGERSISYRCVYGYWTHD